MKIDHNGSVREDIVAGRNAVLELLKSDTQIEQIYIQKGLTGTVLKIAAIAKEKGVVVKDTDPAKLESLCRSGISGGAQANHQGVVAIISGAKYCGVEDIIAKAGDEPLFVVIADEIEDPHNLGAIIRTAEAAGAHGVIIPKRRSAGLTFTVMKSSAGAAAHLPVARVSNLAATIDELKKAGVWFYAADMNGELWCDTDYSGPVGLVIGSEGGGIGRLIREKCDFSVSLPMLGKISSLNASVAAGIVMYEIARQRMGHGRIGP